MKKLIIFACFILLTILTFGQVITPFTVRKSVTQKGGILYLSNTSSMATPANIVQNETPPGGTGYNNNYTNAYVDIDNDASTWMSSSDSLSLSTCSEITWAGLYWGADCSLGDENYATRNQVKLKVNSNAYQSITADYLKDNTIGYKTYHCFKDITSIVQTNGIKGRYTVANVATDVNGKNLFGGWTIVIVYKNNTLTMRNLTVFDGLANVSGTSTVDIPISGFQTPLSGPVNFELGMVVYDGDRSLTGDQLLFKGASSFVNISDALHPITDVFNSTIANKGALTSYRNPSYNNTLGYDANIFAPTNTSKNYIGNNAISGVIRQTTGGETYLTQVVTSAIDVYEPDLRSAVRVRNITHPSNVYAIPGDTLEYTVNGLNLGSDPAINTYITDTIQGNAFYVPNSINVTYGPNAGVKTDAAGDDQAEYIATASTKVVRVRIGDGANAFIGGQINNSPSGADSSLFTFKIRISNDPVYLYCDSTVNNSAHIIGTGNISGNTYDNASNPGIFDANGCAISGTTETLISISGITAPTASANSPICQGGTISFTTTYSESATYLWTGPNGFSSSQYNPTITNVGAANAGTYIGNVYVPGTSCHFTYNIIANINIANAGPDQTGAATCGLTTVTLAGNNPSGCTGVWSIVSGTGGNFGGGHTATSSAYNTTFNGVSGNTYTLRWSLSSPGCITTTDDVVITFNASPSVGALSATSVTCANHLNVAITGGISPYTVSINNNVGTISGYISGADISVSPANTTSYSLLSVVASNGCSASSITGSPATITISNSMGTGTITGTTNAPGGSSYITTEKFPTTDSSASSGGWSNPNNVQTNNNTYTSYTNSSTGSSAYLYVRGLGFALPSNATVDGIVVKIKKHASSTITDSRVTLVNSSTALGSNLTVSGNWPTTDTLVTYGGATNLWGNTTSALSYSVVNNAYFGVRIRISVGKANAIAYIDYASMIIYYHTGTTSYCDTLSSAGFSVSGFSNASSYTWTAPSGASITSGQGTSAISLNYNDAGQSGNYAVTVTPYNACGAGTTATLTVPVTDCANRSTKSFMGNVYWDVNGTTSPQKVDGVGVGSVGGKRLYVTLARTSGTTSNKKVIATTAVNNDGSYTLSSSSFAVSAAYNLILSDSNYAAGIASSLAVPRLSSTNASYLGEIHNILDNSTVGNDGNTNGILYDSIPSSFTNSQINLNFSIKIPTAPVAVSDAFSTNEDVTATYTITNNDYDVDGTITIPTVDLDSVTTGRQSSFTVSSKGTFTVNSSGLVTFVPVANFNGTVSIPYTLKDNDSLASNKAYITVTVNAVNDAPVATASTISVNENTTYNFVVSNFNYTDVESDILSGITIATLPAEGTLYLNGEPVSINQTITSAQVPYMTYIPPANTFGTALTSFTFKVNDAGSGTTAATVTINVVHVNVAPVANADEVSTNQAIPVAIHVLSNDINNDGTMVNSSIDLDPLTAGQQTSLEVPGAGTFVADNTGVVTFTPLSGYYGTVTTISYTVNNSYALVSNSAGITVTVVPTGAPQAVNDSVGTNENVTVSFSVTNNDIANAHPINVSRVDLDPYTTGVQQAYYVQDKGQFYVDNTGMVTFQPDNNFYGTVSAEYTVKDNANFISNIATIKVTVNWVNAAPFAIDDAVTTNEDVAVTFNVTANDYDVDGTISNSSVDLNPITAGRQTTYTVAGEGTYIADNSGNITFTPVANFNGTTSPKGYKVSDNLGAVSDSGVIIITINAINDAPVAIADTLNAGATTSTATAAVNVTANDYDIDGTINVASVDLDPYTAGTQTTYTVSGEGSYTVDALGNINFSYNVSAPLGLLTPLRYTVQDNSGATSNIVSLQINVVGSGIPLASNDIVSTTEDTPYSFDVTGNDIDQSSGIDPTTVALMGSLSDQNGTWSITDASNSPGYITFTPAANFIGTVTNTYTVSNFSAQTSNVATITLTISAVNDAPSFTKGANITVDENTGVNIFNGWATNVSAGPSDESTQQVSFVVTNNRNSLFASQPAIDADGNLSFELADGMAGQATVSVRISDNGGTDNSGVNISAIQTFTISVSPAITVSVSGNGSVTPGETTIVQYGHDQSFTITPETGYHITSVLIDGVSVGAVSSYTFYSVITTHTINANFAINTYAISASSGSYGTISPYGATAVNYGSNQTYTITPNNHCHITDVLVDGISVGAIGTYTFTNVTTTHTISASFATDTYAITASAGTNGTISPNGVTDVAYGNTQAYSISANSHYHIVDVLVDGVSVGAVSSYSFDFVTTTHTISASFAINTYAITASAGANGNITPSGSTSINYGSNQSYTISANNTFHIADVLVDGVSVGAVGTYTFNNVITTHTIRASFITDCTGYTWTGAANDNNYYNTANWLCGVVPPTNTAENVTVDPSETMPLLSNVTLGDVIFNNGSAIDLKGHQLVITGGVTGTQWYKGNAEADLTIGSGVGTGTINFVTGGQVLHNLTTNSKITLGTPLAITGGTNPGTLIVNSDTLITNGNLTIKSNINGTARIGKSSGIISGTVSVERYVRQNTSRGWRMLAIPTQGSQTIKAAWQEGATNYNANPVPGFGTRITSSASNAIANGFDGQTYGSSLLTYSPGTAPEWVSFTNSLSTTPIASTSGWLIYVRGDRTIDTSKYILYPSATTLRTKGAVYQGSQTPINVVADGFNMIGNIYASEIDFTNLTKTGGVDNTFYVWDPQLTGSNGLGAFQTFSAPDWQPIPGGGSYGSGGNAKIQSGMAFLVHATGTAGTVQLTENAKTDGKNGQALGFRPGLNGTSYFKTNLYAINSGVPNLADGNTVAFDNTYSNDINGNDALKVTNFGESMSMLRSGKKLAIERRKEVTDKDTIFFDLSGLKSMNYKLEFVPTSLSTSGLMATLIDNYLSTSTPIDLSTTNAITFTANATKTASFVNRFKVVFKTTSTLPINFTKVNAIQSGSGINVAWTVSSEIAVKNYTVEHSTDGIHFTVISTQQAAANNATTVNYSWLDPSPTAGANYYRINSLSFSGEQHYSYMIKVLNDKKESSIVLVSNPIHNGVINLQFNNQVKGMYTVRVFDNIGRLIKNTSIEHGGGNSSQSIVLPNMLAKGLYQLEVQNPGQVKKAMKLILE